jgi:uncharacterized MAPEG superfamily protein
MHIELYAVCLSVILGLVHIILASHSASLQRGYKWAASARDQPLAPLTGMAGRLERASDNFLETFPFFVAMVVVVHFTDSYGELSKWGALLYVAGRVAYHTLYSFGVFLVRSLAWNVATAGILLLLVSALSQ